MPIFDAGIIVEAILPSYNAAPRILMFISRFYSHTTDRAFSRSTESHNLLIQYCVSWFYVAMITHWIIYKETTGTSHGSGSWEVQNQGLSSEKGHSVE